MLIHTKMANILLKYLSTASVKKNVSCQKFFDMGFLPSVVHIIYKEESINNRNTFITTIKPSMSYTTKTKRKLYHIHVHIP